MVLLLGLQPDKKNATVNSLSLFIRDRGKDEDKGTIVPLPNGSAGTNPQLALHDFDGDHIDDIFVSANTSDGRSAAWILSVKGKTGTVMFDSAKTEVAPLTPGAYISIAAVDADKNGIFELDAVQKSASSTETHTSLRLEKGVWTPASK